MFEKLGKRDPPSRTNVYCWCLLANQAAAYNKENHKNDVFFLEKSTFSVPESTGKV